MKKQIDFPSIGQFRNLIHDINGRYSYVGKDENGDAIYDNTRLKPTLEFKGCVKLHGTNGSVAYNKPGGLWAQSRNNILTVQNDNAGFAMFVEKNREVFTELINQLAVENSIDLTTNTIVVYGEFAGNGIQNGVGICNIEKSFFIFAAKVCPFDEEDVNYWIDSFTVSSVDNQIYNIEDFKTFSISIDFNNPQLKQNELIELTEEVERQCPVAKAFGFENTTGEGIVWTTKMGDEVYRMKTKGEKHSATKVKTLAAVDVEKLNSITEFVEYAVTENRYNQALENVFPNNELHDIKKLGDLIRWIIIDITKEESDTMVENHLEPKDVNKYISNKVRTMFLSSLN